MRRYSPAFISLAQWPLAGMTSSCSAVADGGSPAVPPVAAGGCGSLNSLPQIVYDFVYFLLYDSSGRRNSQIGRQGGRTVRKRSETAARLATVTHSGDVEP